MKCFVLLFVLAFASKNENQDEVVKAKGATIVPNALENPILVKIEEDRCAKKKKLKLHRSAVR